jgi:hypothetical protein
MNAASVRTVDRTILTDSLNETRGHLSAFRDAADVDPDVFGSAVNWLEIYDILDRVKDQSAKVLRPAPRALVDTYVHARTWLREFHPRLQNNPSDLYGRNQLDILIQRIERDLMQHAAT